jgi:ureidoglycolate hydrolase
VGTQGFSPLKSEDYNVVFAEQGRSRAATQIKKFRDTWRCDQRANGASQVC